MLPLTRSRNRARFFGTPFSPESLFENGEVGAWYDPSDYSTLFTDSAGTTPVTGVEQFVGLMLDKSGRGNHAFQTSSAKRPKLAARYNLLTYSEEFDNGVWTKGANTTITPNQAIAPDGTLTADLAVGNGTDGVFNASGIAVPSNSNNVKAIYLRSVTGAATVLLKDGQQTIGTTTCNLTTTWQRFSLTETQSGGLARLWVDQIPAAGIYIWGADLRPASQATGLIGPTYQRVAAATVYDTAGFLPYLAFDGLDDSMSTNSIDFSAGDKMTVWAGVRKLSDASQFPVIVELSNGLNAGTFSLYANGNNANLDGYSASIRGSSGDGYYYIKTYASPITSVWSNEFDIAGAVLADENKPRINATIPTLVVGGAGPAGTGNFGNYPLYIGMRNNASLPFNGWLTSLIVRGAQSTQSQIEATEAWVNGKTGAY